MAEIKTQVIKISGPEDIPALAPAARVIKAGGLVAFPTETVYGLGANALDPRAVAGIYRAKGRPADNPLIVHIARMDDLAPLVAGIPPLAATLMEHFWPGPLTLVLPRGEHVPRETTAGLDTVAVRMPAHPVALALIDMAGVPVAAPSANLSGRPSPTCARHVLADLAGRVEIVIDGGKSDVGVESTVLDMTVEPPALLRPGGVTVEDLRSLLPRLQMDSGISNREEGDYRPRAPGMKYKHYAPAVPLIVVEGTVPAVQAAIRDMAHRYREQGKRVGIMATRETAAGYGGEGEVQVVGGRNDLAGVAANLYACFRSFDSLGVEVILAEGFEAIGLGLTIMNRLRKAAGYNVIQAGQERKESEERGVPKCGEFF